MDAAALLAHYDTELRGETEVADADEITRIGPLWLGTFVQRHRGFVSYPPLPHPDEADALIAAAIAHYEADARIDHFEWKTRGHDEPADLLDRLEAQGFSLGENETVMCGDVTAVITAADPIATGYRIERVTDEAGMRAAEALAGRVFDDDEGSEGLADELVARFFAEPDAFSMWVVRAPSGEVVCSGRVEFIPGTEFAGLFGGACDAAHRGRGLYRALAAARAREAAERGKRFLQVDCTEYSRPILERAGLVPITTTVPAVWRRGSA
ncbi:GNAT family N-acetyltransferase [Gulosibacter macacae]|uniref:GNAT family N-acetyltransferase n=1 Tax=Gulosibacter macacae TaxID=2488791 RepID=A0A3P3VVV3_9MICO|nr:GNAT family N-acetyltransferase [Gulosibacter macacae]RRJ86584.1 GNAT family N-acetyltransferase [Gulosibacter macacae]